MAIFSGLPIFRWAAAVLLLLGVADRANAQIPLPQPSLPFWTWQNPHPTGYTLQALHVFDDQTALVVGDHGTALKTADQGQHWQPVDVGTANDLKAVSFANPLLGWVAYNTPNTSFPSQTGQAGPGEVRKTVDGGLSWTVQPIGEADFVEMQSLRFFSATDGYVFYFYNAPGFSRPGRLRVTTDGGQTWTARTLGPFTNDAQFLTPLLGYTVANGAVRKTTDGGLTFTAVTPAPNINYKHIWFVDAQNGYVGGGPAGTAPNFFRTTDGGTTWTPVRIQGASSTYFPEVDKLYFTDLLHGTVNGLGGGYATTDGGQTWVSGGGLAYLGTTRLRPSGAGFSVGYSGQVVVTNDYGLTGHRRDSTFMEQVAQLHFPDPTHGWAVGSLPARVARTTNRGITWQLLDMPRLVPTIVWGNGGIRAGAFPDADTAYVAGREFVTGGAVFLLKTTDGGQSWQRLPFAAVTEVNDLKFRDCRHGLLVGDGGRAWATQDGGQTWLLSSRVTTKNLRVVSWATASVAYAVGDSLAFLRTSNGGQTWQPVNSPFFTPSPTRNAGQCLDNICFTSASVGYYGDGSFLFRTSNSGQTWTPINMPGQVAVSAGLSAATFRTPQEGWAIGNTVQHTIDGGLSWQRLAELGSAPMYRGSFQDSYNGWLSGVNGGIVHYSEKLIQTDTTRSQPRNYCAGGTLAIAFSTEGSLSQTPADYWLQVSNKMGRFRKGETLTLVPTAASSARLLRAVLPLTLAPGTHYRLRVIAADSSVLGGDNGRDLAVSALATASISPAAAQSICQGSSLVLTASPNLAEYAWSTGETTRSITVSTTGTYTVRGASVAGCLGAASAPVAVAVVPQPAQPVVQQLASGQLSVSSPVPGATYQWLLGSAQIAGATQPVYPATGAAPAGTYTVVATVNGCASPASVPLAVVLGTVAGTAAQMHLYPNPARATLWLERPAGAAPATVQLLDIAGRVVWQGPAGSGATALPVQQVPAGLYLVRLQTPTGPPQVVRVAVEH